MNTRVICIILAAMLLLISANVFANYDFVGDVERFERIPSGVLLHCSDGVKVKVAFQTEHMFRVTLIRPDYSEPLLEYAISKTDWMAVNPDISESGDTIFLKTNKIDLEIKKSPCRLTVKDKNGFIVNADDPGMGMGWDGKEVRCWKSITDDERFFGLGEKAGGINKRGTEWVMWNSDIPGYGTSTDPLYVSVPFFVGLRNSQAYGIYFNNSYRSKFNMGAGNLRYFSFAAEQGNLDYFFIYGPEIRSVVESYTQLTGRTPIPPKWAVGYQQCRYSYYPDSEVLSVAKEFRKRDIPCDVIYLDIHYMDGYRIFTWDKERFPDPLGMTSKLGEMGFKVIVIIDPGVKEDPDYIVAQQGLENDYFVKYPDGETYIGEVWPGRTYFPDFSNPDARSWWGNWYGKLLDEGIDGFWNDMNEPAVWGKAFPEETLFHDEGNISSHKKMHNLYGALMVQSAYEGLVKLQPDKRPFLITRAAFAGAQRYTSVWTGDNIGTEEHLELGIRMMLGMGISGIPFNGMDVGGFLGDPSGELFVRWNQVGMLSPFYRNHKAFGQKDQEPWVMGDYAEFETREIIKNRYRLLPYLYTLFYEAQEKGHPLWRPLYWYYQDDEEVYNWSNDHQFFVGEQIMAAPVTREGHYLRKVYFPEGKWLDLNTELVYIGPVYDVVDAPRHVLPLFLKEGGILVTRESQNYVGEKSLTELKIDLFPGDVSGSYDHYEDDGESFGHKHGEYRITRMELNSDWQGTTFVKTRIHDEFDPGQRNLWLRFHRMTAEPREVLIDGKRINKTSGEYGYTYEKGILSLKINDTDEDQEIRIR